LPPAKETFKNILYKKSRFKNEFEYINLEYVGKSLGDIAKPDTMAKPDLSMAKPVDMTCLKKSLCDFFIGVLNLRLPNNSFLIHGDPHSGNICYTINSTNGCPLLKYIDITTMEQVQPDQIVAPNSNIIMQFSSMVGLFRAFFGWSDNKIADDLKKIQLEAPGKTYSAVLSEIIEVLSENIA